MSRSSATLLARLVVFGTALTRADCSPVPGQLPDLVPPRGTPVVVNVWCPPCRAEAPALVDIVHDRPGGA